MTTYLIRRAIEGLFVIILASFFIYSILTLAPGGPLDQIKFSTGGSGRPPISQSVIDNLKRLYKLDKPWPINYLVWLFDPEETTQLNDQNEVVPKGIDVTIGSLRIQGSGVINGDFGESMIIQRGQPATKVMGERIGKTLILMTSALLIALLIAFPVGIISALRQYSRLDYTVTTFSFLGLSMPSFWLGLMLIVVFALIPRELHDQQGVSWMPYLPTGDVSSIGHESDPLNRIYHLILPVSVLAFINIAAWARYVRSSMLEVLRQDYVRTAWAKGLKMRAVILKHALRNALIPLITILALTLPGLVQGALITEQVFNYAGMGRLYIQAVISLDFPLAMAFLMVITVLTILSNMLADVLYAVVDPRIRYS
jgi:peptide/nickel transport system permease protein